MLVQIEHNIHSVAYKLRCPKYQKFDIQASFILFHSSLVFQIFSSIFVRWFVMAPLNSREISRLSLGMKNQTTQKNVLDYSYNVLETETLKFMGIVYESLQEHLMHTYDKWWETKFNPIHWNWTKNNWWIHACYSCE